MKRSNASSSSTSTPPDNQLAELTGKKNEPSQHLYAKGHSSILMRSNITGPVEFRSDGKVYISNRSALDPECMPHWRVTYQKENKHLLLFVIIFMILLSLGKNVT
jgi:hypothetical protein